MLKDFLHVQLATRECVQRSSLSSAEPGSGYSRGGLRDRSRSIGFLLQEWLGKSWALHNGAC